MYLLGTPLFVTDYAQLARLCLRWAREPRCRMLEFVNTQIVTMARHDARFRETMQSYDDLVPDGMPLIWLLNARGATMPDRVYGPAFMRMFLSEMPMVTTHYFLGGSAICGSQLREVFARLNPNVRIVGSFHGRCLSDGNLEGEAENNIIDDLNRLSPDFIWVGFGTPKQQLWAAKHKRLIQRGVVLTVGFAFDANAGLKPDAPNWMQRRGLTWLFRMCSEPARLGPRYLKWNSLFLWYLLADTLRGRAYQPHV